MKNKIKTKSFWVEFAGAVILILQTFGLKINVPVVNEVISALCAIAILVGVMVDDTKKSEVTKIEQESSQTAQMEQSNEGLNLESKELDE